VECESRKWNGKGGSEDNRYKVDPTLKRFIFALKNPHNFPARKFEPKTEMKDKVIYSNPECSPHFCDFNAFYISHPNDVGLDDEPFDFSTSRVNDTAWTW
jgi:hypothetical protein